ncbi:sensor histidine kinase [Leucobacter sp. wl10]|uniref:sensor histidine kinase n=1 Tax=Leucobacter sp. wl10 TaxID=2304677 RepID=UPI000E5BAA81|nr:histidine kinase [Leucobacter sp. wl10]RGE22438.1 two-component sensor histidine kinase [Leucobacter sp. wl10]
MTESTEAEVRLPRPPGVIRRALAAHPVAVDVFIVVWYLIGSLFGVFLDFMSAAAPLTGNDASGWFQVPGYLAWPWWPLTAARIAVVSTALLLRRRFPLAGLVAVVLASIGEVSIQGFATAVAILFMIYAVPVYRDVAAGWLGYGIAVVGAVLQYWLDAGLGAAGVTGPGGVLLSETGRARGVEEVLALLLMTALWYLAILMLGINLGNRRRYLQAVIDRAHQLARERDQLARLAVAEERSRIAREMHDIVAHSVSVMIALSEGASRVTETAPEAAADAMRRSAETGRTALAEMRRLLGALHSSEEQQAELVPQPGVEELPGLVEGFVDAGLAVSLEVSGEAAGDRGQDLAVYRVVQEGLTNVLRYAGTGARARVTVMRQPDRSVVQVRDYGSPAGAQTPVADVGSGRGLTGLAERARVFGGRIESGPVSAAAGGGWRLWAELPVNSAAVPGPTTTESEDRR